MSSKTPRAPAPPAPHLIGIAGHSGAGKTALASELAAALLGAPGDVLSLDAYYVDRSGVEPAARARLDYDGPEALDWDLLRGHLHRLAAGRPVERPVYDFRHHVRSPRTERLVPGRAVVVEGRLALYDAAVRALLGTRVYVATDTETCLSRRVARDTRVRGRTAAAVRAQWEATVQPAFARHVEPTRRHADLVVDGTQPLAALAAAVLRRVGSSRAAPG